MRHMFSPKRFVMSAMPTGSGKSLTYMMAARMSGQRTCILTSTKGLQSQLMHDFGEMGLVDVRGANAYACSALRDGMFGDPTTAGCDEGPCRIGVKCSRKLGGCLYFDAVREACGSQLVVTNYAYYLYAHARGKGLGKFDRLVLDECHDAHQWLCDFLSGEITRNELALVGTELPKPQTDAKWRDWAEMVSTRVSDRLERLSDEAGGLKLSASTRREIRVLNLLADRLERMADVGNGWVIERAQYSVRFSAVWAAKYAEQYLFRGIPHVDSISATASPKMAELLGVQPKDLDFADYPSDFPPRRRPVIHVPTVRMSRHNTAEDEAAWVSRMDDLISDRLDRKGIIHTVSYQRREQIMARSRHRDILMAHSPSTARSVFEQFRLAPAPRVLVTPAATTGWDFPMEECEYQIIVKVPFPDLSSTVMKARAEQDKKYGGFLAALTLVQMVGRGMRSADDMCETLVLDDHMRWFLWQYREFLPDWFRVACTSVQVGRLPRPLPKIRVEKGGAQ